MKNLKKLTAAVAATLMAASMAAPMAFNASAVVTDSETANSIVIENGIGTHTYTAYLIVSGDVTGTGDNKIIANPDIDDNMKSALTGVAGITAEDDAAAILTKLSAVTEESAKKTLAKSIAANVIANNDITGIVSNNDTIEITDSGWYLIVDTSAIGTPSAYSAYILGTVDATKGATIEAKSDAPTVVKKVQEDDNKTDDGIAGGFTVGETSYTNVDGYNDIADYSIGELVPFKIYGTLPSNLSDYDEYYYCFNDSLDTQFTAPAVSDITVKVGENDITSNFNITVDNNAIKVECDDVTAIDGVDASSIITVSYSAVLNSTAKVGKDGQDNKVNLTYSNNPNADGKGTTPDDEVKVYTYGFEFEKAFAANGSESPATAEEIAKWKSGGDDAIQFELKDKDGNVVYVTSSSETGWNYVVTDSSTGSSTIKLFENESGKLSVKIKGLDEGKYTLNETNAPEGYNAVSNVPVEVNAKTGYTQNWDMTGTTLNEFGYKVDSTTLTEEGENVTGIAKGKITNNMGNTLPSTGGIGTTLFYLGGGAMVAVAGIFLITKKRMGKDEA